MLILFSTAVVYSTYYAVSATISDLFSEHYPFLSETEIGLCFLSIGAGGASATILQGKVLDWQFRLVKKQWERKKEAERGSASEDMEKQDHTTDEGGHDEDFPIEQATLQTQFIWILLFSAASVGYGWAIDKGANIAVSLVLQFFREYLNQSPSVLKRS